MIVILRVIRWQTLHGPGYLQQRFAPRPSAGANLFFQQLVQFQIYLGELIPVLRAANNEGAEFPLAGGAIIAQKKAKRTSSV